MIQGSHRIAGAAILLFGVLLFCLPSTASNATNKQLQTAARNISCPTGPGEKLTSFVCQVILADKNVPTTAPK